MTAWDRYWFDGVAPIRPRLLRTGFLLLLSIDICHLMIARVSVLNIVGFNVTHFPQVAPLQLLAEPAVHVVFLTLASLLALAVALGGLSRAALPLVLVLYTATWASSRLDSYQHHYLISLLLVCLVFMPTSRGRRVPAPGAASAGSGGGGDGSQYPSCWGFTLAGATTAIVYLFAAIAKLEPEWLSGQALAAVGSEGRNGPPLGVVAVASVAIELGLAAAYATAPRLDRGAGHLARALGIAAALCALALHGSIEMIGLRIGWFSYYMMLLAFVFLLPTAWLERAEAAVSSAGRGLARIAANRGGANAFGHPLTALGAALVAGGVMMQLGRRIGLPGAGLAFDLAALLLLGSVLTALFRASIATAWRAIAGLSAAAAIVWACVTWTDVAYEFFAYRGVTLARLGFHEEALAAHLSSERHARQVKSAEHRRIGSSLHALGRLDEATIRYRAALETDPQNTAVQNDLGVVLQLQGQVGEALVHFRRAVANDPSHAEAHANLAALLGATGAFDGAIEHYQEAVRLRPGWPAPLVGLSWALLRSDKERAEEVARLAESATELTHERDAAALEVLAAAYASAGRFDDAIEAAERALAVSDEAARSKRIRADLARYRQGRICQGCARGASARGE